MSAANDRTTESIREISQRHVFHHIPCVAFVIKIMAGCLGADRIQNLKREKIKESSGVPENGFPRKARKFNGRLRVSNPPVLLYVNQLITLKTVRLSCYYF